MRKLLLHGSPAKVLNLNYSTVDLAIIQLSTKFFLQDPS
jgi:hypothetical protein